MCFGRCKPEFKANSITDMILQIYNYTSNSRSILKLQFKKINICLTFALTDVHFGSDLNYVGHVDWQKIITVILNII